MSEYLAVCPIGLGNYIMATPALKGVSDKVGAEHLCLLALKKGIAELAETTGWFRQVYLWDPDKESLSQGMQIILKIRRDKIDISFGLFPTGHWKFCLFQFLCGIPKRAGFDYAHGGAGTFFLNQKIPYQPDLHDVDQNIHLVKLLVGQNVSFPEKPSLPSQKLSRTGRFFVCHPGSSTERGMAEKRIPTETLITLLVQICETYAIRCKVLGSASEKSEVNHIIQKLGSHAFTIETRDVTSLVNEIEGGQFYVGNDSGLMHISSALGIPCAVFFGPSNEHRTGPYTPVGEVSPHLIIRHPDDSYLKKSSLNPKLAYAGVHHLHQLKATHCQKALMAWVGGVLA